MPPIFRHQGYRGLTQLSTLALLLAIAAVPPGRCLSPAQGRVGSAIRLHAVAWQEVADPPPLAWKDLLNCELVVVGRYKSHKDNSLSLEVGEVLRGTTCKAGDVLPVKLAQTLLIEPPTLYLVDEQGKFVRKDAIFHDLTKAHVYFFPKEKRVLERPSQIQPDWHNGWKQALAGQPINLNFPLAVRY